MMMIFIGSEQQTDSDKEPAMMMTTTRELFFEKRKLK